MDYEVLAPIHESPQRNTDHSHIIRLITGSTAERSARIWTIPEVYAAMDAGHRFFVRMPPCYEWILLKPYRCCEQPTVRFEEAETNEHESANITTDNW